VVAVASAPLLPVVPVAVFGAIGSAVLPWVPVSANAAPLEITAENKTVRMVFFMVQFLSSIVVASGNTPHGPGVQSVHRESLARYCGRVIAVE